MLTYIFSSCITGQFMYFIQLARSDSSPVRGFFLYKVCVTVTDCVCLMEEMVIQQEKRIDVLHSNPY